MLESLRRQGASIFVYLIFCLLIAIFIINFRPGQTRQGDNGCTGESNPIIEVGDEKVSSAAWHVAYSGEQNFVERMVFGVVRNDPNLIAKEYWAKNLGVSVGPQGEPMYRPLTGKTKVHFALENLIRRELLAQEAEARGLKATDGLLEDQVKKGEFFLAGERVLIPGIFDENGYWNLNAFKGFLNELNVSKNSFYTEQKRSLLAWMMAKVLVDSVQVSRDEAYQLWLYERSTVTYDVVAFKPAIYADALKVTDADLDKWLAAHEDEVKAKYKADERTYKNVPPQLHLREIFIAAEKDKQDEAKKKLDDARAAIAAGKQKFADAAKELNTDEGLKAKAGDLEWRNAETPAIGEKAISDAVKTLKPGEMTPVVAGDKGVYLVTAEAKREGDLAYDTVKKDIAMDLARQAWGKEAAKRAALAAVEGAHKLPGADLEKLYEKDSGGNDNIDLQKLLQDPSVPDDVKKKLIEQKLLQNGTRHGWIDVPGTDVLAGSYLDPDGAGGGAAAGSGSAAPAGSGSAAATPPAPPPAPAPDLTPTKEELPKLEPVKAHVTRYGPTPREKDMSGLGSSADAKKAVFEELKPGEIANKIFEADGNYIVVQLVSRDTPEQTEFEKDADAHVAQLRERRAMTFLDSWLRERCEALLAKNRIVPNVELLRETDDKGNVTQSQYRPCQSFH